MGKFQVIEFKVVSGPYEDIEDAQSELERLQEEVGEDEDRHFELREVD